MNNQAYSEISFYNNIQISIDEVKVEFPFQPYETQMAYMKKVIQLYNNKLDNKNYQGIDALESPTGTGKTLSLLCSTLAWYYEMKKNNKFNGKIIYATRTHSQISQIIKELKKTNYRPIYAILSSRKFSCVNNGIKNRTKDNINQLNIICRFIKKRCEYKNDFTEDKDYNNVKCLFQNEIVDIEDLCKESQNNNICPFYQQKHKAKYFADIIFMPYNYLINEQIRTNLNIYLDNNIIIIDEAHNIRKVCEDEKSFEISEIDFIDIRQELNRLLNKKIRGEKNEENESEKLFEEIKNYKKNKNEKEVFDLFEITDAQEITSMINLGEEIKEKICNYKIIRREEISSITYKELINLVISCLKKIFKEENKNDTSSGNEDDYELEKCISLLKNLKLCYEFFYLKESKISLILKLLILIFNFLFNPEITDYYGLFLVDEQNQNNLANNKERKLKVFCFNPEIAFKEIISRKPFAVILTSGNLKPFDILEKELNIKFDITLENKHIINNDQFKFTIIKSMEYNNIINNFNFKMANKGNKQMILALGEIIIKLCSININGGILVFFPSYSFLQNCYFTWQDFKIDKKIEKYKIIYKDSFDNKLLVNQIIKSENKDFILLSVHRGSLSEGIDFSDDNARMVICVGIPFANISDDKIRKKKEYLDNKENCGSFYRLGRRWYEADAMINVNQSLGRCIRNINDYGAMICIDERFCLGYINELFSCWIAKNKTIKSLKENDTYFEELKNFFEFCKNKYNKQNNLNLTNIAQMPKNLIDNDNIKSRMNAFNLNLKKKYYKNVYLQKRKRERPNFESKLFLKKEKNESEEEDENINNNYLDNINDEEENVNIDDSESIDNNNIDTELFETIKNNAKFDHDQFQKLQNNPNVIYMSKIEKCPICFTNTNQSIFLGYSISKCNHIICNICWNNIISDKKECPLCKRKIVLSDLKKIILNKWMSK